MIQINKKYSKLISFFLNLKRIVIYNYILYLISFMETKYPYFEIL